MARGRHAATQILLVVLTIERAGQTDQAIQAYEAAPEVYPDFLPAIQGLASLVVGSDPSDPRIDGWLEQIALRSAEGPWREWAGHLRLRRPE